ncbi:MAG: HAD-IC family P-type ATPase, partial [Acidobacteriota bacterium]|nr:HAD-IC family P-type ATPase [Acidobacteriota bacterium]
MPATLSASAAASGNAAAPWPGLTSDEAAERLARFGPNDPTPVRRGALAIEILLLFLNPLVVILLVAALISGVLGERVGAAIIAIIVFLSIAINFAQTYRSRRAISRLREHVSLTATVLRDGQWQEIKRHEIVPDDIVRLSAGDLVPADAQLLDSRDLFVQQAALTGESMPAEKHAQRGEKSAAATPDALDRVFLGTSVVSGTAIARIVNTGPRTQFGAIAERLADRPEETEFERGLRHFGMLITRTVFFLVLFILVVRVAMHKNAFESFVFAVALAVGLTPEFLPMITSVTLARGAVRMARDQVIVKRLPAIQNFGSIDIFCSDKTGTLTTGVMSLEGTFDPFGHASDRAKALGYLNSKFESGIRSPLDEAILRQPQPQDDYVKRDEIPFDFNRRRLSIAVAHKDHPDGEQLLITKGAPEGVLAACESYEAGGAVAALDAARLEQIRAAYEGLFAQGYRVLGVAYRRLQHHAECSLADESSLILAGFLAFSDPPKPDAAESLAALQRDGVQVKILTGDHELVARHVCRAVSLENPQIITGDQLDDMSDPALGNIAERVTVFARVSPMQKLRIISALKRRSHVVGYMGDGIN